MRTLFALGLGLVLAFGAGLWIQTARLERERTRATSLVASLESHRRALELERQQAQDASRLLVRLQDDLEDARNQATARAHAIERLSHENQSVRDWRDTPLPADLARMLQRPALRGSADYRNAPLPYGDPLPPAGSPAPNQRGAAGGL